MKFSKDSKLRDSKTIEGTSKTYKATDLCYINGVFIDPGYIHDVLLTGLEPSTTYYYSCGIENVSDFLQVLPPLQINDCGIIYQRLQMYSYSIYFQIQSIFKQHMSEIRPFKTALLLVLMCPTSS